MSYAYSAASLVAAHTAFRDLLDTAVGTVKIRIRDAGNVLLAEVILDDPCGTVNGTTGQLTLTVVTQETNAPATGTAATAQVVDGANAVHLTMPCQQGSVGASGACVLSSLGIIAGGEVSVLSAVIG